jgi:hypothetical protein
MNAIEAGAEEVGSRDSESEDRDGEGRTGDGSQCSIGGCGVSQNTVRFGNINACDRGTGMLYRSGGTHETCWKDRCDCDEEEVLDAKKKRLARRSAKHIGLQWWTALTF